MSGLNIFFCLFVSKERGEIFNSSEQEFLLFILGPSEWLFANVLPNWITLKSKSFLLIVIKQHLLGFPCTFPGHNISHIQFNQIPGSERRGWYPL